jgi:hypothetical protein
VEKLSEIVDFNGGGSHTLSLTTMARHINSRSNLLVSCRVNICSSKTYHILVYSLEQLIISIAAIPSDVIEVIKTFSLSHDR